MVFWQVFYLACREVWIIDTDRFKPPLFGFFLLLEAFFCVLCFVLLGFVSCYNVLSNASFNFLACRWEECVFISHVQPFYDGRGIHILQLYKRGVLGVGVRLHAILLFERGCGGKREECWRHWGKGVGVGLEYCVHGCDFIFCLGQYG